MVLLGERIFGGPVDHAAMPDAAASAASGLAPSLTGPARICTARLSAHIPPAVTSRILASVARYAPGPA
ncbi:hypothetical protein EASAB2608_07915 [Streptomyces sp. EAS-AB2608]|nr:hypothetical protein EASAB2608_07915 [Streptomyces sp. EAS-AB2608]CUW26088.1 hypothetical protein TUE45_00799 [Streptomyces reticuli]